MPAHWQCERWAFEGTHLAIWRSRHARAGAPLVLLAHGRGGHAMQWDALARVLLDAGFDPVAVDFPGHGHAGGARSSLPQVNRAIGYVAERLALTSGGVHAVVAHSMGAAAAAAAVARGTRVARLVLVTPAASAQRFTRVVAQVFGLSEATRAALQARVEAREAALMHGFEPPQVGARIDVPTLVVHDRGDTINPLADGLDWQRAIAGAQLHLTDGLGHRRLLGDAAVADAVRAFLR